MLGAKDQPVNARAERLERQRLERRLDAAQKVIAGVESRLSSLAYCAPEVREGKLLELEEVCRRLVGEYRAGAVGESDTDELRVAA